MKVNDRCHHSVINYHSVLFTLDGSLTSLVVSPDGFVANCTCSDFDMVIPDEMGLYSKFVEFFRVLTNQ